jgi:hypothetical protein
VWPNGKLQDCAEEVVIITSGNWCKCHRRIAFNIQCRHKLCKDGKLEIVKYSTRWLNHRTFNAISAASNFQMPLAEPIQQPHASNPLFTQGDQKDSTSIDGDDKSFGGGDQCKARCVGRSCGLERLDFGILPILPLRPSSQVATYWEFQGYDSLEVACLDDYGAHSLEENIWDDTAVPRLSCPDTNGDKLLIRADWEFQGYKPGRCYVLSEDSLKIGQRLLE